HYYTSVVAYNGAMEPSGVACSDGVVLDRKCTVNWFGQNCDKQCVNCKDSGPCDRETGECRHGCSSGWTKNPTTHFCDLSENSREQYT
ncbi:hypothetical protein BaRGS_00034798, partial [Batillaria attramentaria]